MGCVRRFTVLTVGQPAQYYIRSTWKARQRMLFCETEGGVSEPDLFENAIPRMPGKLGKYLDDPGGIGLV